MATKEEIQELEMFLRKENKFPVLINNDGEPALESTNTNPTVAYINVERFMNELEKYGMTVDRTNLVTVKKEKLMPKPMPGSQITITEPAPRITASTLDLETEIDTETIEEPPVWTEEELEEKSRKQLQAIARKHDDIAGNATSEDIRAALCGTEK